MITMTAGAKKSKLKSKSTAPATAFPTPPVYKTCVSVGESTPALMRRTLAKALKRSEYAEARLDYLSHRDVFELLDSLPKDMIKKRIVCTLRAKYDGGRFKGMENTRINMLRKIASEYSPWLLDVELSALRHDSKLGSDIIDACGGRMLASWHDYNAMPTIPAMRKRLEEMARYTAHLKIACRAGTVLESVRMLEMYRWLAGYNARAGNNKRQETTTLISFAMGEAGRLTRILCMHMESPYTYVSLDKALAPGQLSLAETEALENALRVSSDASPRRTGAMQNQQ